MAEQNKKRGRKKKVEAETNINELVDYMQELCSLNDYITQYGSGASLTDISLKDLYTMLRNPYANIKKIQNTSKYFSNRYGIVKDIHEAFRHLPTLNGHLVWSNYENPQKVKKYERKVQDLIFNILNMKRVVRDGLGEQAEVGTIVAVNRNNKYVQFLDLDNIRINKQQNGKWIVEIDLQTIKGKNVADLTSIIESLPDEVTVQAYNQYRNKGEEYRFVPIKNAYVLNIRGNRNFPYGLPITLPAWGSLIHKSLIEQVEKSVADRLIKSILVLYAESIGANNEGYKPPGKEIINRYFNDLSTLIKKKDAGNYSNSSDTAGTGLMLLPSFMKLEGVKLDTNLFPKELYDKLQSDILSSVGVSGALIYGGGTDTNYGSAQMNSEKFYRYIFGALEQWEDMINDIIKNVLPADLDCKFFFDKTTISDKEKDITAKKEFYMQTGIFIPWAESVLGVPYSYALGMKEYQDKVLKLEEIIRPAASAYTQSGNDKGGRPEEDVGDGNMKNKDNKANDIPSPSDK